MGRPKKIVIKKVSEKVEKIIKERKEKKEDKTKFFSTGCTLLDLCLGGGFPAGKMINIVGDRSSGKTLLGIEAVANLVYREKGEFVYDDAERGFTFDTEKMYRKKLYDETFPMSQTIEQFETNIETAIKKKKSDFMIYILDSWDSLDSEVELKRDLKKKKQKEAGKEVTGSFGMTKQKDTGTILRRLMPLLAENNVCLIIISQVRENIGVMFGEKFKRSGGKAIDFYESQEIWLSECDKKEKKERKVGITIKVKVKKNKVGLPFRECFISMLFDYGIDNVSTNLDFLFDLRDKKGKFESKKIKWDDTDYTPAGLLKHIEENNLEQELIKRVKQKWYDIEEEASSKNRKERVWK